MHIGKIIVPRCWKHTIVKPLPKVQQRTEIKHLLLISLLPTLSKLLKRILYIIQLNTFITSQNHLPSFHSGIRSGYSCTTALLEVTEDIVKAQNQGKITALVLFYLFP